MWWRLWRAGLFTRDHVPEMLEDGVDGDVDVDSLNHIVPGGEVQSDLRDGPCPFAFKSSF